MVEGNASTHWVTQRRLFGILPIGSVRPIQKDIHLVAPPSLRGHEVVAHVIFDSEGDEPLQMQGWLPGQSMPDIRTIYTKWELQNVYAESRGDRRRHFVPRVIESPWMERIGIAWLVPQVVTYRF